eukprot:57729-Chlamydomonas_euryale.AAC.1
MTRCGASATFRRCQWKRTRRFWAGSRCVGAAFMLAHATRKCTGAVLRAIVPLANVLFPLSAMPLNLCRNPAASAPFPHTRLHIHAGTG